MMPSWLGSSSAQSNVGECREECGDMCRCWGFSSQAILESTSWAAVSEFKMTDHSRFPTPSGGMLLSFQLPDEIHTLSASLTATLLWMYV